MKDSSLPFSPPIKAKKTIRKTGTDSVEIGIGDNTDEIVVGFKYSYDNAGDPRTVFPTEVFELIPTHWNITFYNLHTSPIDITVNAVLAPKD
ncbi:hypothetical protein P4324_15655 [Bacillus thuringiensis]|nr:hypothetical protein [Bacillus thuringiensis]MED2923472.1 hypothetical protein [Bacillus thuringiensis]MED3047014.1 hypothetical protein [Bacillus thuringiensis]